MTLHLVRHATAGRRAGGPSDMERPLDDVGRLQAERVCDLLGAGEIDHIFTSPAVRCQQTVAPLAAALGAAVEITNDLWEGRSEIPVLALLRRLAAASASAVLCSHGDMIPRVLDQLARTGVPLAGSGCAKGSVWSLEVTEGLITGAKYIATP